MAKICDNKSTGILFWKGGKLLLIERKKYNPGFAPPAGHNDGDDPETTARKESTEEIGFVIDALDKELKLVLENPCKRENGSYHALTVFEAKQWHGELRPSDEEVKSFLWASPFMLTQLANRLEQFMRTEKASIDNLTELVRATNESEAWKQNPGLEPPWYVILRRLDIV